MHHLQIISSVRDQETNGWDSLHMVYMTTCTPVYTPFFFQWKKETGNSQMGGSSASSSSDPDSDDDAIRRRAPATTPAASSVLAEAAKRWKAVEDEVRKDKKAAGERDKKSKKSKEEKREKKVKKREKKAKKEQKRKESERLEKERRAEERNQAKLLKAFMSGKDKDASSKLPESEVDAQIEAMLKDLGLPDEAKAHTSRTAISASLPVLPDAHPCDADPRCNALCGRSRAGSASRTADLTKASDAERLRGEEGRAYSPDGHSCRRARRYRATRASACCHRFAEKSNLSRAFVHRSHVEPFWVLRCRCHRA